MNEQTVTEVVVVDEAIIVDSSTPSQNITPAIRKALEIGSLCNNAFVNDEGNYVGHSTDVALLNVLSAFGLRDYREVTLY